MHPITVYVSDEQIKLVEKIVSDVIGKECYDPAQFIAATIQQELNQSIKLFCCGIC